MFVVGSCLDSSPRIHVLPELLVRKIAAGEVIERPASVLKELVENALDAGASRITIHVEDGGAQMIRVTDDGCGMTADELRLAVAPHATSKITSEDDLFAIATLGFRGEALASISAVSRLRIISRAQGSNEAFEIRLTGDALESARAAGAPPGTTVEVRDLFFNVPARRKFLRAVSTEVGHINEQFTRFALAYPNVGMELTNNRRTTYALPPAETRLQRIARFFGPELSAALLPVQRTEASLDIEAYAALPAHSRATPQWQYMFVNGRYIRDRYVQHAVREAYRGLMEPNRHAVVFLFLTIHPSQIDVNVHPTKIEVRWADANLVHSQVLSALRETFQRADLSPALRSATTRGPHVEDEQDRLRREFADSLRATAPIGPDSPPTYPQLPIVRTAPIPQRPSSGHEPRYNLAQASGEDALQSWRLLYGRTNPPAGVASPPARTEDPALAARPRAIQMHNLYLVVETEDGIIIVDQHALHERVIYDQLRRRLAEGDLEPQRLLLPETLKVSAAQAAALELHAALLNRLGIEVTPFGADSVAVHTFPSLLKDTQVQSFMRDLLDALCQQEAGTTTEIVIHRVLDMMACKAAVKAGDPLTADEIDALINQRHLIDKPSSCPHGRPTMLRLTKADLARQFKRT